MPSRMHILDFLILAVTFLCIIHSHSSASDRHRPIRNTHTRHQSPSIDTQTQPPLRTAIKQDSQQTLHDQSNPNHARHRNQPRTTQPQVSVWHMSQGSYIQPVSCCVRHLQHLACTCNQPSTNRSTTSHGTVYHEHLLNCMLPKVKFPPVKGTF